MHDAHYHYSKEINALQNEYDISGICNVANEKEFELVQQMFRLALILAFTLFLA